MLNFWNSESHRNAVERRPVPKGSLFSACTILKTIDEIEFRPAVASDL
jgi:hypothetical protein